MIRVRHSSRLGSVCAIVAFALVLGNNVAARSAVDVVYNFTGGLGGGNAATGLIFDASGDAYGTSVTGGASDCGTIFKLAPTSHGDWSETVLHSFDCFAGGKNPHGGVTLHGGNLYGTTVAGGSSEPCTGDGCGEIFELSPNGFTVLYAFRGGADGFGPGGAVVFDRHGNLYGTTPDGGGHASGTLYELAHTGKRWTKTTIHRFTGKGDGGAGSLGALLLDSSGDLFGVTEIGGLFAAGTAYRVSPKPGGAWKFDVLYAFKGRPDAGSPYGGLIADRDGNLYGTTYYGGANGLGAIFELRPTSRDGWNERVVYSFKGGKDGALPTSTLAAGADGSLYATTSGGGIPGCDCGTIVKLDATTRRESVVHAFASTPDGAYPYYGLTANAQGALFGTTVAGGTHGQGAVFRFVPR